MLKVKRHSISKANENLPNLSTGTSPGIKIDLERQLSKFSNETCCFAHNIYSENKPTEFVFPWNVDDAIGMARVFSLATKNEKADQDLLSASEIGLCAMLGDQSDSSISDREKFIALAFFNLGMKTGEVFGVNVDYFKRSEKHSRGGRNSHWQHFEDKITEIISIHESQSSKTPLKDIKKSLQTKHNINSLPSDSTIRRWINTYRETGKVFKN